MVQPPASHRANLIKAAAVAVTAVIGAFLSRWHGGGFIGGSPKLLKAFLWSLPFALSTWLACFVHRRTVTDWLQGTFERLSYHPFDYELLDLWVPIIAAVIVLLACMVFKNTGHGGGMDMATSPKEPGAGRTPEKLEYLILWLHPKMPRYWYDSLLLSVIGTFSTLAPALAVGIINPMAGVVMLAGGTLGKPVGYMIGWKVSDDHATEIGEALTGLFAYTALSIATLMVI